MAGMRFEKWQALGNDYLIVERDELPFEADARARAQAVRGPLRRVRGRRAAALAAGRPGARGRPAHLQPRRLGGGAVGQRRARGDPVPAPSRLDRARTPSRSTRPPGRSARRSPGRETCTVDMGRASLRSKDFPGGPRGRAGTVSAGGRVWAFRHVSIGNPQCAIHVDCERELDALDLAAIGPAIEAGRAVPQPHERVLLSPRLAAGDARPHPRADLRAGGGRDAVLGHGRHRRGGCARPRCSTRALRPRAGDGGVLDGGELEVEVGEDLRVNLTGWARPVFAGRLSEDFEKELHETE